MALVARQLAVAFADISGSTALYLKHGNTVAREIVEACLSQMIEVLPAHGGRLVKTIGDAVMAVFPTADQAMLAASQMQSDVMERPPCGHRVFLHIGLHFGPVIDNNGDVYGDTVNAASYLAAVASADQILITESTYESLSPPLRSSVRPIFRSVLKGSSKESGIFQILWHKENVAITNVNTKLHKTIPPDMGKLRLEFGGRNVHVDHDHRGIVLGRDAACDVVVDREFVSRRHAAIQLRRTHYYLVDQSINGTFVTLENGLEMHVLRGELFLGGAGIISLGRKLGEDPDAAISYRHDRRALYRV
jgi:class 3 adenylate cyclase